MCRIFEKIEANTEENLKFIVSLAVQSDTCTNCDTHVMASERRYYCRNCGHVLCFECSDSHQLPLEDLGHLLPVQVCEKCYQSRKTTHPKVSAVVMDQLDVVTQGPYLKNHSSLYRFDSSNI